MMSAPVAAVLTFRNIYEGSTTADASAAFARLPCRRARVDLVHGRWSSQVHPGDEVVEATTFAPAIAAPVSRLRAGRQSTTNESDQTGDARFPHRRQRA